MSGAASQNLEDMFSLTARTVAITGARGQIGSEIIRGALAIGRVADTLRASEHGKRVPPPLLCAQQDASRHHV